MTCKCSVKFAKIYKITIKINIIKFAIYYLDILISRTTKNKTKCNLIINGSETFVIKLFAKRYI